MPCRLQTAPFSTSPSRTADKLPFTEKVRRRIWGTDKPPGQADPYGGGSVFDRSKPQYENEVQEREERQASRTVPTDLSGYEPAANWDGLEMVGGWGNWWKENWDPEHPYIGFAEGQAVTDSFEATAALRRAVIESFTLQQAGRSLSEISKLQTEYDPTYEVEIAASGTGATVQFPANAPVENVLVFKPEESAKEFDETKEKSNPTPSEEDVAADRSIADPLHPESTKPTPSEEVVVDGEEQPGSGKSAQFATYDELVASWNPAWLEISLANQELKFAVFKRVLQLTGKRIPDHAIQSSETVKDLLSHIVTQPKPRRLAEELAQKEDLLTLPNVSVYSRRITPIDKERAIGRWKVIEKELEARDLPVTGS
ncbi:hypothetical protein DH86_00004218 [Scytalidium sp. 3C]|nr:hypothetical protein DH86_00004218 [Scytalidium sp. 3C]